MSDKLSKIIEEVSAELNDDTRHFQQDFIAFRPKEFQAVREAEIITREKIGQLGKGRVIGLACGLLARVLADGKEKDDEKV
jgi:hypothetical protein